MQLEGWKKRQFEILCRIDDICRENGIGCFLHGDTALCAVRDGDISDFVSVCIEAADVRHFIAAIEESADLKVTGMFNNYRCMKYTMKVYDPKTMDFNISELKERGFTGLYVTVHMIAHIPESARKAVQIRKNERAYRNFISYRYGEEPYMKGIRSRLVLAEELVMPPEAMAQRMFYNHIDRYSNDSKEVSVSGTPYKAGTFESSKTIGLLGKEFTVPADAERFLREKYGINWKKKEPKEFKESAGVFRDAEHSWKEYEKYIDYLDFDEYAETRRRIKSNADRMRKCNKLLRNYRDLLGRTHARFSFWQELMPRKDEIVRLHGEKDYRKLREILDDYITELEEFRTKDMTICFDKDIFEITMDVLRHYKMKSLADAMKELVPEEHLQEIRIKDYKGDYI